MNPSFPYPLIQLYERQDQNYKLQKTIRFEDFSEVNEVNGMVELILSEPIDADFSVLGIYFPNNSTEISFGVMEGRLGAYKETPIPLEEIALGFFRISQIVSYVPLITIETGVILLKFNYTCINLQALLQVIHNCCQQQNQFQPHQYQKLLLPGEEQ